MSGEYHSETPLGGSHLRSSCSRDLLPFQEDRIFGHYDVGTNNVIYHNYQTSTGWSGEAALGGSAKQITVGRNQDGRLEVFYVGTDDAIYHNYQTAPNGGWSGDLSL